MKFYKVDREDLTDIRSLEVEKLEVFAPDSLDYCCNDNGKDVQCLKCGEFYENSYLISEGLKYDNFESVIISQCFDDIYSENYIEIVALSGCPCCELKGD